MFCKHILAGIPFTCAAFPTGIPFEIFSGQVAHDKPLQNDNGIQYEPSIERLQIESEDNGAN
jgi:hypothetical protein